MDIVKNMTHYVFRVTLYQMVFGQSSVKKCEF
ncbi:hypothetical protein DNH24_07235 [Vibrio parahaemolyticus]|nr:hypothetical protein [Vibrio parahaemolyticus]TNZ10929.1 hypothetical protein CGK55_06250 [Vibrio parahaemolyticus]